MQGDAGGCRGMQGDAEGCRGTQRLQRDAKGCRGLQRDAEGFELPSFHFGIFSGFQIIPRPPSDRSRLPQDRPGPPRDRFQNSLDRGQKPMDRSQKNQFLDHITMRPPRAFKSFSRGSRSLPGSPKSTHERLKTAPMVPTSAPKFTRYVCLVEQLACLWAFWSCF